MQLETNRFGQIDVEPESIITFTQPIVGFQEYRRYVLLPGPGESLYWLQSTESGDLAFILLEPTKVVQDYTVQVGRHELDELGASSIEELEVYTLVVVPQDASQIRTNLKAPILINQKLHLAKQTILDRSDYPIQFFLAEARGGKGRPQETSNARTDT